MEFGLRHAHDMRTQVFAQLASSSRTSSRAGRKLNSVMQFDLKSFVDNSLFCMHMAIKLLIVLLLTTALLQFH